MTATASKSKKTPGSNHRIRKAVSDEIGARIAKMEQEEMGEPAAPATPPSVVNGWDEWIKTPAGHGHLTVSPKDLVKVQDAEPGPDGEPLPPAMTTEQAAAIAAAAVHAKTVVHTKPSKPAKAPKSSPKAKAPNPAPKVKNAPAGKQAAPNANAADKPQVSRKPASKPQGAKKMSCLDAAAQIMSIDGGTFSAKGLIERMAADGLWSSPGGKTPEASLYAAIVREIAAKGSASRFEKVDKGLFRAR